MRLFVPVAALAAALLTAAPQAAAGDVVIRAVQAPDYGPHHALVHRGRFHDEYRYFERPRYGQARRVLVPAVPVTTPGCLIADTRCLSPRAVAYAAAGAPVIILRAD